MEAGTYKAYPIEFGTSLSESGKPFVFTTFETEAGTITWKQYLTSDKGFEIAVKALVAMGFKDEAVNYLNEPDALDSSKPVSISVEMEEYNGKKFPKVKWVNSLKTVEKKSLPGISLSELFKGTYDSLGIAPKKRLATFEDDTTPF